MGRGNSIGDTCKLEIEGANGKVGGLRLRWDEGKECVRRRIVFSVELSALFRRISNGSYLRRSEQYAFANRRSSADTGL